jgi:hypothetical protein
MPVMSDDRRVTLLKSLQLCNPPKPGQNSNKAKPKEKEVEAAHKRTILQLVTTL